MENRYFTISKLLRAQDSAFNKTLFYQRSRFHLVKYIVNILRD